MVQMRSSCNSHHSEKRRRVEYGKGQMFVKQTADDLNDGYGDDFRRILPHFRRVRRLGEFQAGIQRLNDANVDVGEVGVFAVGHAHAHFVRSGHFGRVRIGHAD